MKEILIVDKNSNLLLTWLEWEETVVDNSLKIETDWEKLIIVVDAELSIGKVKTDWLSYYKDWKELDENF